MRDEVAVGNYRLDEKISSTALKTGESFSYEFNVYGEGNVSAIEKPEQFNDGIFDVYEPNVRQNINRSGNRVTGTKTFSYFMIPKEPGEYKLSTYFNWVFFNPTTHKYDTLKPKAAIQVEGESLKNEAIESADAGTFYDRIASADNSLKSMSTSDWLGWTANILLIVMLAGSVYFVIRKA